MATVTGLTAARMIEIEDASIVSGSIVGDNLVLQNHGGTNFIAGNVRGPQGPAGPAISSIDEAPDVMITSPSTGQVLTWDGTRWVNANPYMPTGLILAYPGATAPPGFLLCNGAAIPAGSIYLALIALIGANTPDLRGRFIYGTSGSIALNSTGGAASVVLTPQQLALHNHAAGSLGTGSGNHRHRLDPTVSITLPRFVFSSTAGGQLASSSGGPIQLDGTHTDYEGDHTHTVTGATAVTGSNEPHENLPPYRALTWVIKY